MSSRQFVCGLLFVIMMGGASTSLRATQASVSAPVTSSQTDQHNIAILDRLFQDKQKQGNHGVDSAHQAFPVEVQGNERVQQHAIVSRLNLPSSSQEVNSQDVVHNTVRILGESGLFSQVSARLVDGVLKIQVKENPSIHQVGFEGNKAMSETQLLQQCAAIKPRRVLSVAAIREAVEVMQGAYRASGYYAAVVTPHLVWRDGNRVDVVFKIVEGQKAEIRHIVLVGNRSLSTKYLRARLLSKERMAVGVISKIVHGPRSIFNPETAQSDQKRLRDIYVSKGYLNAHVSDALVELDPTRTKVSMTYNIAEGDRYTFGTTTVVSECPDIIPVSMINTSYSWKKGHWFNIRAVEACARRMTMEIEKAGHPFYVVDVERSVRGKEVDLRLVIRPTIKRYVGRIRITGNSITNDRVIRRTLTFHEGDALTPRKHKASKERLAGLNIFEAVEIVTDQESGGDRGDVTVRVKEKSSHSQVQGGLSYDNFQGFGANVQWMDYNFMGTGNSASFGGMISRVSKAVSTSVLVPHWLDRNMSLEWGATFDRSQGYTVNDLSDKGAYYTQSLTSATNVSYALTDHITQTWGYIPSLEKVGQVENSGPASWYIRENVKGHELLFCSKANHALGYNTMYPVNDHIVGVGWTIGNLVAGLGGGTQFAINSVGLNGFYTFGSNNQWRLRANVQAAVLSSFGYVRFNNVLKLGGFFFPGFASSGVGPRDVRTQESLGGKYMYTGSLKLDFPLPSSNELPVKGVVHVHTGSLWGTIFEEDPAYPITSIEFKNRVSVGFGFFVAVPKMGNLGFVYSRPVVKGTMDRVNCFEIVMGREF